MKSANLQSSTNPFVKKLKWLCTQPFIFIAAARKQLGLFGPFCVDEMLSNVWFFYRQQLICYFDEIKYLFAVLRTDKYEVGHLQQHLVNYGKFSEVP